MLKGVVQARAAQQKTGAERGVGEQPPAAGLPPLPTRGDDSEPGNRRARFEPQNGAARSSLRPHAFDGGEHPAVRERVEQVEAEPQVECVGEIEPASVIRGLPDILDRQRQCAMSKKATAPPDPASQSGS
jgi:hypothetical protein